jgi:DNA-binding NtrC family response regulator
MPIISSDAMKYLMEYSYPGNIRELKNIIERMVILNQEKSVLFPKDIPEEIKLEKVIQTDKMEGFEEDIPEDGVYLNKILHNLEKKLILKSLKKTAGNKKQAASLLRIKRTTLIEKIKKYQNE